MKLLGVLAGIAIPLPVLAADLTVPVANPDRIVFDVYSDTQCPLVCGECWQTPRCPYPPCADSINCCDTWQAEIQHQNAREPQPDHTLLNGDIGITSDVVHTPALADKFYGFWNQMPDPKSWVMGNHEADPGYNGGSWIFADPENYYAPANWWEPLFGCTSETPIENCRRWYSVYFGTPPRVALLVVNNNSDTDFDYEGYEWCMTPLDSLNTAGSTQRLWFDNEIEALPPSVEVVFVAGHRTYYGVENFFPRPNILTSRIPPGGAPAETLRTGSSSFLRELESIRQRKPSVRRVFMVSGDQHCFSETLPLRQNQIDLERGIVYLTLGISGACNNRSSPFPKLSKIPPGALVHAFDDKFGTSRFVITPDRVEFVIHEAYTDSVLYQRDFDHGPSNVRADVAAQGNRLHVWPNPAAEFVNVSVASADFAQGGDLRDLAVYDVRGRRVRKLHSGGFSDGQFLRTWDFRDDDGKRVAAGIYFLRAVTPSAALTARVVTVAPTRSGN